MSEPKEVELIKKMNRGRAAETIGEYLNPLLAKHTETTINDMVAKLQEGETNFCAHAGKFNLINDIRTEVKREITAGNNAAKDLNNGI